MDFIKKYWWVLLLLGLAVWAYWWFMIRTPKVVNGKKKTGTCKKIPQTEWDAKVDAYVIAINENQDWHDDIIDRKDSGETDEEAVLRDAKWMVTSHDLFCPIAA